MAMFGDPKTNLAILERLASLDFADLEKRIIYVSLEHDHEALTAAMTRCITPNLYELPPGFITNRPLTIEELSTLAPFPAPIKGTPKSWGKKGKRQNPGQAYQAAVAGKTKGFR